uniref:SPIN-DOC-like zinc-finger domain-containing protein n=1 Tax=Ornithorhynchus anatinus TaxID=9258 RepID=A0A6I8PH43_ORNAN
MCPPPQKGMGLSLEGVTDPESLRPRVAPKRLREGNQLLSLPSAGHLDETRRLGHRQLEWDAGGSGEKELLGSWEQEYLVGSSPGGSGRTLCLVCGEKLSTRSARAAKEHILGQHPHTLGLSPAEKCNILEAWCDEAAWTWADSPPGYSSVLFPPNPDLPKGPAEIEVSLDPEEQPLHRRRAARPMQLPAPSTVEGPGFKIGIWGGGKEGDQESRVTGFLFGFPLMPLSLFSSPHPSPEPDAAPAEIRLFSDGSFPAGFTFRLFSKSRMESPKVRASFEEKGCTEGDPSQAQSPLPASSSGLRGALGLKVIHLCLDDSPTGSLLQDWPNHPQGPKGVGTCDTLRLADGTAGKC